MTTHCSHNPCLCPTAPGSLYCCPECEQSSSEGMVPAALDMAVCTCGHASCLELEAANRRSPEREYDAFGGATGSLAGPEGIALA